MEACGAAERWEEPAMASDMAPHSSLSCCASRLSKPARTPSRLLSSDITPKRAGST